MHKKDLSTSQSDIKKKCPKLQVIPHSEWIELRQLYRRNWPQHIVTCYTINNYIRWVAQNPHMQGVRILTIDNDWREHGTFLLEDRDSKRYNIHFNTLRPEKCKPLVLALKCIDKSLAYTLTAFVEQVRPAAEEYLHDLGLPTLRRENKQFCQTVLYYLPKEKCLKLRSDVIPGFIIRPLSVGNVEQIDELWPHQYPGSDYLIHRIVSYNLSFGAFETTSDILCGWVMQVEDGAIGMLHVKDEYKRRGIGGHLVCILCKNIAELGMDATATVLDMNLPSRRLFEKFGFKIIDRVYWYDKLAPSENITTNDGGGSENVQNKIWTTV